MKKVTEVLVLFLWASIGVAQTLTFTDSGGPYDILDNNCDTPLDLPLSVTGVGALGGTYSLESVNLNISHARNFDVIVELIDPSGAVMLTLVKYAGRYGNGFEDCIIRDSGSSLPTFNTVVTGTFFPYGPGAMNDFNTAGINADGDWTLRVCDRLGGGTGRVDDWSITFVSCDIPVASFNAVPNCPVDDGFSMEVDITDIGAASSVTITDDQGTSPIAGLGIGTYSYGNYANGDNVMVTVTNDDDGICFDFGEDTFDVICPPQANNLCANAIPVSCGIQYTGSTDFASNDAQGVSCDPENEGPEVWYSYTGNGTLEHVNLRLCDSGYNTVVTVYSGECGTLTCVDYDIVDECYPLSGAWVEFISDGTTTYYFAIEGLDGRTGDYVLDVTCIPIPLNDLCENAIPIDCGGTYNGTLYGATNSNPNVSCGSIDDSPKVWYSLTIPASAGRLDEDEKQEIDVSYATGFLAFYFFGDVDENGFCSFETAYNGTNLKMIAVPGETIRLGFGLDNEETRGSDNRAIDDFTFTVTCVSVPAPSNNNTHLSAAPLVLGATPVSGDTTNATGIGNAPSCSSASIIRDLWYTFVAPANGDVSIVTMLGTADQANVTIWEGCDLTNEIACSFGNGGENVSLTGLTPGNTYYVQVSNEDAASSAKAARVEGSFTIAASETLSLPSSKYNEFQYFPNPVDGELVLIAQSNIQNIIVYNMLGQEVLVIAPNALESNVDMSGLQSGIYFVNVMINDITETIRVIKS